MAQTLPARAVIVQADNDKEGSAVTRNRALEAVRTPWVAFLDDDDQFLPHHLQRLSQALTETQADVVYPLPRVLDSRGRSEEHTSELQSLMRISYAVFCLKKKNKDDLK